MSEASTWTKRRRHSGWQWPNGAKIAVTVGLALEAFNQQSQARGEGQPSHVSRFSLSYGDYGWKAGVWRLLDLLDQFGITANMATNAQVAESRPEIIRAVADAGHEIGGHGWVNDVTAHDNDVEAERAIVRRCTEALTAAAGTRPLGWISPGLASSGHTREILVEEGYLWNGDDASDDLPFLHATPKGRLVILPRTNMAQNDLLMWLLTKNPPDVIWCGFKDTFDQLYIEGISGAPNWTEITLHAHIAGRPTLIPTIRKCLAYAKRHDGVWFAQSSEIARWALCTERKTL
jgi:peptidoglycan/xylan/chitin deacetylase (PgdA/CDA1 family)